MKNAIFGMIAFSLLVTMGDPQESKTTMNDIAERYVKLVLAVGEYDSNYVDAYHGPEEWQKEVKSEHPSLIQIHQSAETLLSRLSALSVSSSDSMQRLRHQYLTKQLQALPARVDMLKGKKFTFDEESKALYDAVSPSYPDEHYRAILKKIEALLPGTGTVQSRYEDYRKQFIIPKEKLDSVLQAAIKEGKKRTKEHIQLPENETFALEFVTGKPWSGYNWYKGNYQSLIQVNTDLPVTVDRAIDLACHVGYPGHHVYNVLLEQHLLKERGWMEITVYPLYYPQSLIAEGTANFGIQVAFPGKERVEFEKAVLFPLAGINPNLADSYYALQNLMTQLAYAPSDAARRYLDGKI